MSDCDSPRFSTTTAVLATAAAMFLILVLPTFLYAAEKHRRRRLQQKRLNEKYIRQAIGTTSRLDTPAAYIRADTFCDIGRLVKHEQLRDEGKLIYKDTLEQLNQPDVFSVFISHQWTASDEPDPGNIQYPVMVAAVKRVALSLIEGDFVASRFLKHSSSVEVLGLEGESDAAADEARVMRKVLSKMVVWVDYVSIPQTRNQMQELSIRTLSSFCSTASAFVVVAPIATHKQTGEHLNFTSYQTRMWCRAEQFCHAATKGLDSMWIATSEGAIDKMMSHKLLSMGDRWLLEMLHVFEGSSSDDVDKIALVTPILGLYAEMYACGKDVQNQPAATANEFLCKMLEAMESEKETIFPAQTKLENRPNTAGSYAQLLFLPSWLNVKSTEVEMGVTVTLFGKLIPQLERILDADEELRNQLRDQALLRRGLTSTVAKQMQTYATKARQRGPSRRGTFFTRPTRPSKLPLNSRATRRLQQDSGPGASNDAKGNLGEPSTFWSSCSTGTRFFPNASPPAPGRKQDKNYSLGLAGLYATQGASEMQPSSSPEQATTSASPAHGEAAGPLQTDATEGRSWLGGTWHV